MPEVELRKDPLGANRGRSFLEQAGVISGDLSSQVRKKYHDKYYTPPYRPTNRHWEMTFASLGFNRRTIEKFWRLFCQINNCTDTIRLEHFLEHFDLDWTPWSERCFKNFDTKGSGEIDFLEFMITVWNICTFKIDSLSNFTFDMYDLDSDGELSLPEIERMVEELYGTSGGKQCLKEAIEFAEARGGALNLNSFTAFTGNHQLLLFPVFQIQRKIQQKVFGVRFWENVERSSKENFNDPNAKNEFNPRHVQILMKTYQAVDPNKGLQDWHHNWKEVPDVEDEAEKGNSKTTGLQRWVDSNAKVTKMWNSERKSVVDGGLMGKQSIERMKELKLRPSRGRTNNTNGDGADMPPSAGLPATVAFDLHRIRAKREVDKASATTNSSDR
ncbi:hypothetical protein ACHAW5_000378 [Stephanodiscus triporus]|uniref:EF-hand domain-containing protein n=1 Tax=Stephanodiscus triporus TaxID=2934178 RepID=A0ABD3N9M0_9STRA